MSKLRAEPAAEVVAVHFRQAATAVDAEQPLIGTIDEHQPAVRVDDGDGGNHGIQHPLHGVPLAAMVPRVQCAFEIRRPLGQQELLRGFDFLVAVIGLFGVGEILVTMEEGLAFKGGRSGINARVVWQTWKQLPRYWATAIRGTLIGCWMGITPGGATPASFMGYGVAQRFSKHPQQFGKGAIEGVVAPETAAHAAGTSALLPMLTLGIPGSPTAAVLLGGLLIWGLQPGPMLFVEQKDFVWGLIASMYLGNLVGLIVVLTAVPLFASILRIPFSIIAPIIIVICAIGAYTVHNAMLDIWFMMGFGVVGYVFKKLQYPMAPLVLALVLGDMAEVGDQGPAMHAEVGAYAHQCGVDALLTLGPAARGAAQAFGPQAQAFDSFDELLPHLLAARPGHILVKGSRSMRMERVVQALDTDAAARGDDHAA